MSKNSALIYILTHSDILKIVLYVIKQNYYVNEAVNMLLKLRENLTTIAKLITKKKQNLFLLRKELINLKFPKWPHEYDFSFCLKCSISIG